MVELRNQETLALLKSLSFGEKGKMTLVAYDVPQVRLYLGHQRLGKSAYRPTFTVRADVVVDFHSCANSCREHVQQRACTEAELLDHFVGASE
jgi:hypothetical protein